MDPIPNRAWFKKKRYLLPIGALLLLSIFLGSQNSSSKVKNEGALKHQQDYTQQSVKAPLDSLDNTETSELNLTNNNYYTNSAGNRTHSPAYAEDNAIPNGASARCGDGTYSFSQSRRGTCSHHGGVSEWIN